MIIVLNKLKMRGRIVVIILGLLIGIVGCDSDEIEGEPKVIPTTCLGELSFIEEASNIGIPLFTGDQARWGWTEMNTEYNVSRSTNSIEYFPSIQRLNSNSYLNLAFENFSSADDFIELSMSAFKKLNDGVALPSELASLEGISFRAAGICHSLSLSVDAIDLTGNVFASQKFLLKQDTMSVYQFPFTDAAFKKLSFSIFEEDQVYDSLSFDGALALDDVYLLDGSIEAFSPSDNDIELLSWLREASIRQFLWYYDTYDSEHGYVLESSTDFEKISISGLGYAYAIFVLAEQDGLISAEDARSKTLSMLKWQQNQNWFDGSGGWHGFPHHYFKPNGFYLWPDVSTIDWAMNAAGIRVARQRYKGDTEITSIADELLDRPDWTKALAADDKIAMGFDGATGEMNDYRWALAFSEETELVYLEAVASGKLDASIFDAIEREKKGGFYPSWFAAGFTYNWLQLWTGTLEPFAANSKMAYVNDALTCQSVFGKPLMGLTACATIDKVSQAGFINWTKYISNQGSDIHGASSASEVIQVSPAPYGAALGLPFAYNESVAALREYVDLGFYHPLLGLPDNVRLASVSGASGPAANWEQYDINIGPTAMAIEQIQSNSISGLYLNDPDISVALPLLVASFEF